MVLLTGLHKAANRAGRHRRGRGPRAAEGPHMDNYDEEGLALRALQESRRVLG